MPDEISADRVTAIATAARVPLAPIDAERISCAYGCALRRCEDRSVAGNRAGKFCRRAAAGDREVKDPAELTLAEVAGALRRRTFSSAELTRWMLERIGRWQPIINAFVRIEEDEALAAAKRADRTLARGKAKGALYGVPLAHKDMYYVKGKLSECGSKVRKGWIAPATSTVLIRLAVAGSFRIGALHMSEFAYSPTGHNSYLGPARNAWDPKCITGGSSSGSANRGAPGARGARIRYWRVDQAARPFLRRDRVQGDLWTRQPRERATAFVHPRYRRPAGSERGGRRPDHGHHCRA